MTARARRLEEALSSAERDVRYAASLGDEENAEANWLRIADGMRAALEETMADDECVEAQKTHEWLRIAVTNISDLAEARLRNLPLEPANTEHDLRQIARAANEALAILAHRPTVLAPPKHVEVEPTDWSKSGDEHLLTVEALLRLIVKASNHCGYGWTFEHELVNALQEELLAFGAEGASKP